MKETGNSGVFNAILVLAFLIGLVVIYFVFTAIRYHKRYIKLQKDRLHAEINTQENERKRIANDLHDSIGPLLSSVKLQINSVDISSPEDERIIENAGKYLDEIIGSMREISYNLLPNTLQRKGLIEALREFAANISAKHHTSIQVVLKNEVSIDREKEIHVFRIVQEIIHNTIKHAEASRLQLSFGTENKELVILTQDDGKGFDVEKMKRTAEGFGMKSMESRIEMLSGHLDIKSGQHGTSFLIRVPL